MAMGRRRASEISSALVWRYVRSRARAGRSDDTPNGGNDGEGSGAEGGGGSGGEGEGGWDGRVGGGEGSGGLRRAHAGGGRASCCDGHVGRPREKVALPRSIAPSEVPDRGKTSHSMPPAAAVAQAAASTNRQQVEETHPPLRTARTRL